MASYTTAWIVGSVRGLDSTVTIAGSAQDIAGDLYLYHPTSALSLLGAWVAAATAAGLGAPTAVLTRDRRVKLGNGANFTVAWGTDPTLRDLLGFTGNLSGASSYTAPNVSPLLWSPAKPLRPDLSPLGTAGIRTPLAYWTQSPYDGSTFVVSHGSRVDQRYSCVNVPRERVYPEDEAGGSWIALFDQSASLGASFYVWPEVEEEDGSATAATLADGLGPYVLSPSGRAPRWGYVRARGLEWLETHADITFDCRIVPEYT